jgi:hypothetical protein
MLHLLPLLNVFKLKLNQLMQAGLWATACWEPLDLACDSGANLAAAASTLNFLQAWL